MNLILKRLNIQIISKNRQAAIEELEHIVSFLRCGLDFEGTAQHYFRLEDIEVTQPISDHLPEQPSSQVEELFLLKIEHTPIYT